MYSDQRKLRNNHLINSTLLAIVGLPPGEPVRQLSYPLEQLAQRVRCDSRLKLLCAEVVYQGSLVEAAGWCAYRIAITR